MPINYTFNERQYHKQRRMFAIIDGKVRLAPENVEYSHITWFVNENWIISENDERFEQICRGIRDPNGDLIFYTGKNWDLNEDIEKEFFDKIDELVKLLDIDVEKNIYGGTIKSEPGTIRPYRKNFGKISEYL